MKSVAFLTRLVRPTGVATSRRSDTSPVFRRKPQLLSIPALTMLFFGLTAFAAEMAPVAVRTATPKSVGAAQPYQVPGRTEPAEAATIFTRATGIVKTRNFDIGDVVKAGDVLAVIDVPDLDRAVEASRANVDASLARAEHARALAQRAAGLLQTQATSQEDAEQRASTARELEAAVRVARADLAKLEEQQKFATVRAPFTAVVAARNFDRGDRVRGDAATAEGWLYRLVRLDTLRFAIAATPDLALRLGQAETATIRFAELPGRTFTAKLARSSRTFDPASGTMRVEFILENPDLAIPSGLTGTASFELKPAGNVLLVPTNTIVSRDGQDFVVAVNAGKATFVAITPGRNLGSNVEVTASGLTNTTPIIVNPNAMLRAGDPVELNPRPSM